MKTTNDNCVFCKIINKIAPADIIEETDETIIFTPLNPVVPGHILVVPKQHVTDFADNPTETAVAMYRAAEYAKKLERSSEYKQFNLITSKGDNATQTVFHLHIHLVPRFKNDGLLLPWSNQHNK